MSQDYISALNYGLMFSGSSSWVFVPCWFLYRAFTPAGICVPIPEPNFELASVFTPEKKCDRNLKSWLTAGTKTVDSSLRTVTSSVQVSYSRL